MNVKNFKLLVPTVLLVIGAILLSGCAPAQIETPPPETPAQIIENVTPQEAFTLIQENQNNPDFAIIDVRTPEEFAEGHIEDSVIIDYYYDTFRNDIDQLDKSKMYLIYCRSGNRSGKALDIMAGLGFQEVYNMLGGIIEWNAEGLPTTK